MLDNATQIRRTQRPSALIAGGLPAANLPVTSERPALVAQAQALACEQNAFVIAWPRQDSAVITPAAPPRGLVAGGLGLLLPPEELVVEPEHAAAISQALTEMLEHPTAETVAAAQAALAQVATPEA